MALRGAESAAALQPATYPLINAATLSLLSGDRAQAAEIAREVLARIAAEPEEPETPYYRAATEAEALLLLGRREEARAALAAAVAAAPHAWEDHGSTLRQFVAIETDGTRLIGPTWKGLFGKTEALVGGGTVTVDENYIRESITDPAAKVVATFAPSMPTYQGKLSDRQLSGVIEYIKTLK